tara:strand:- start:1386 stop:2258 length:873 start_codon:yes stop_codon:yes gene_type:complete
MHLYRKRPKFRDAEGNVIDSSDMTMDFAEQREGKLKFKNFPALVNSVQPDILPAMATKWIRVYGYFFNNQTTWTVEGANVTDVVYVTPYLAMIRVSFPNNSGKYNLIVNNGTEANFNAVFTLTQGLEQDLVMMAYDKVNILNENYSFEKEVKEEGQASSFKFDIPENWDFDLNIRMTPTDLAFGGNGANLDLKDDQGNTHLSFIGYNATSSNLGCRLNGTASYFGNTYPISTKGKFDVQFTLRRTNGNLEFYADGIKIKNAVDQKPNIALTAFGTNTNAEFTFLQLFKLN